MAQLSESVARVIDQLARLPGIGRKSAERIAYHLLRVNKAEALELADAIRDVRENVHYCQTCCNLAEGSQCSICRAFWIARNRYSGEAHRLSAASSSG